MLAQEISEKRGGPYTKSEQEKRRDEVYRLHFEHGYSATRIAELMNVNRNTINSDIGFLNEQFTKDIGSRGLNSWLIKECQRLETQRARLIEELQKCTETHHKISVERLIFDISNTLSQLISKLITKEVFISSGNDVDEKKIEEFIRYTILDDVENSLSSSFSEDTILFDVIQWCGCNMSEAREYLTKMNGLGLELCYVGGYGSSIDLLKFAYLRNYISYDEYEKIEEKIEKNEKEFVDKEFGNQSK